MWQSCLAIIPGWSARCATQFSVVKFLSPLRSETMKNHGLILFCPCLRAWCFQGHVVSTNRAWKGVDILDIMDRNVVLISWIFLKKPFFYIFYSFKFLLEQWHAIRFAISPTPQLDLSLSSDFSTWTPSPGERRLRCLRSGCSNAYSIYLSDI